MSHSDNKRKISKDPKRVPIEQLINNFNKFLKSHSVGKNDDYTHTSFGPPWGKFYIDDKELDKFYDIYTSLVHKTELYITEKPKNVGILLIDIDWKFNEENKDRSYTINDIKYVINKTNIILKKYYKLTKKMLKVFVFEKENPSIIKRKKENKDKYYNEYKDGFHLCYPYLALTINMRYLVLDELKKKIYKDNGFNHIPFKNNFDEVIDVSIVRRNGWFLYGSKKYNGRLYKLTHIFRYDFREENIKDYKIENLVRLLSNRKYNDNECTELKQNLDIDKLNDKINRVLEKYGEIKKKHHENNNDSNINQEMEENNHINKNIFRKRFRSDIDMAKRLVSILSNERANDYHQWIRVGWVLHNISDKLLDTFKEFSKRCPEKYDENCCEKIWKNAKDYGLTIASLHMWAKHDNPIEYVKIIRENINELFEEAETGKEYDIAKVIFELYKHYYRCASIQHNIWYEFQGHRWVEIESAYTLDNKLSEELIQEFALLNSYIYAQSATKEGVERDNLLKRANNIMKIMLNLKTPGFKKRVIEECAKIFKKYDPNFEEKLDNNRDLIGFNNGVYDLSQGCFRDGTPDDYVTFTVGYDYEEYSLDHPYIKYILEFFKKVQRNEDMREYILTLLASYLDGYTEEQKFIIWTGTGCFSKGTKIMMFDGSVKNVENIKIGDKLMGDDYTPRTVKHLYHGFDEMYKIKQSNGLDYIVNGTHRLALRFIGKNQIKKINQINTINVEQNGYIMTWYEFDKYKGIVEKKEFFLHELDAKEYLLKNNSVFNDEFVIMTVNQFIKLSKEIQQLFVGYKSIKNAENNIYLENSQIMIEKIINNYRNEYCRNEYGEYFGFEVDKNQKILLADGTVTLNSNGKSKTIEFFQTAFGDYCGVLPITVLTRKRGCSNSATPELAEMKGKRFVVFQEPEGDDKIYVGFMKELTGSDYIYARPLFRDPIKFKPQFKLLLTCNKLPFIPSTDGGTWRRLRVAPWESEFVDVDTNGLLNGKELKENQFPKDYELTEKMNMWKRAFLWLLINKYYKIYKSEGLHEPEKVLEFTKKYKKSSDIFLEFLEENFVFTKDKKDFESLDIVYSTFKNWYKESFPTNQCPSKKELKEYLINHDYDTDVRYLYGVKFYVDENNDSKLDIQINNKI